MRHRFARHLREFAIVAAATIAATALARAAELPSRDAKKAAPQRIQSCDIDGQPGFKLPGGDTCVRVSGYVSAGVTGTSSRIH